MDWRLVALEGGPSYLTRTPLGMLFDERNAVVPAEPLYVATKRHLPRFVGLNR